MKTPDTSAPAPSRDPEWDDTAKAAWPAPFEHVVVPSSADGSGQHAILFRAPAPGRPLLVSLHTWSAGYLQRDPRAAEAVSRGWNYIHPDFRGYNNRFEAMGGPPVVSDIQDAVLYAIQETGADSENVHILGASGGGHAALLAFMKLPYPARSFSAWVPISDIEAWFLESRGRSARYADDILAALGCTEAAFDSAEAARRSPLLMPFPAHRDGAELFIYTGIHDGYTGSVPTSQSMLMYNRLVGEMKYGTTDPDSLFAKAAADPDLVAPAAFAAVLARRTDSRATASAPRLGDRAVHLARDFQNIHLRVFEGGHQQLDCALDLLPAKR